ncbi:phage major capsid protein [Wenzhouxiangella sp. XN201]|uniref:phage major capsid protein n=1 Tax=Wenzhouxiangella sp. XN201 TaxID=2710755 RepID=UPI0013CBF434|nr:phage major capsid protein [Wenzhouxiangella sp. XN201]NEZ03774.1 phage major capsid protein [Wenzhouxiangella sp. XN201]
METQVMRYASTVLAIPYEIIDTIGKLQSNSPPRVMPGGFFRARIPATAKAGQRDADWWKPERPGDGACVMLVSKLAGKIGRSEDQARTLLTPPARCWPVFVCGNCNSNRKEKNMSTTTVQTEQLIKAVETSLDDAVNRYEDRLDGLDAKFQEFEQNALTKVTGKHYGAPRTPGDIVSKSERLAQLKDGQKTTGRITLDDFNVKTLTSLQGSTASPEAGIDVIPSEAAGLFGIGRRNLSLLDVIPRVATASNAVRYTRVNNFSNAAAVQAGEGATKAEQTLDVESKEAQIATVAVIQKVSRQVMDDVGWLQGALNNLFQYTLRAKLEAELIAGNGSGFNISGFTQEGQAVGGSSGLEHPDQIGDAIADMQSDGYPVDYLIVNPSDFQTWRRERSSSDNLYVSGSWAQPNPPVLWNVPAILSPSISSGSVVLANNGAHALLDRQAPTVEMFEQDGTNVEENLISIRAELRAGLAVMDQAGVRVLSLV